MAKYCVQCGQKNKDDAKFCGFCGADMKDVPIVSEQDAPYRSNTASYDRFDDRYDNTGDYGYDGIDSINTVDTDRKKKVMIIVAAAVALALIIGGIAIFAHSCDRSDSDGDGKKTEEKNKDDDGIPDDAAEFDGRYYKVYDDSATWAEAKEKCEKEDGHLATITSAEEQEFIADLIKEHGTRYHYWIGATDEKSEGIWEWITGEEFSYENWDPGNKEQKHDKQPNAKMGQDYVEIQNINNMGNNYMTWNDMVNECDNGQNRDGPWYYQKQFFGYICEWE